MPPPTTMPPRATARVARIKNRYCPQLMKALLFMLNHFKAFVTTSDEFLMLSANELVKIIESDRLIVKQERMVCNPPACPHLPSSIILAVGGWSEGSPINDIEAYDIGAKRWVKIPNVSDLPRVYHGVTFFDGSVYCVGGCNGSEQFNTVQRFDLTTHTWQELVPMHSYRCYVSVTAMDGYSRFNSVERYQPSTNQWTLIPSMHQQRSDTSCTTLHHKVGGFNGTASLQTVEAYDPHTNTWLNMPPMLNSHSNFGISVIDDCLFVVGGYNGFTTTSNVDYYNVKLGVWIDACDMEISHSALSCRVVYGLNNMAEYTVPTNSLELPCEEEDKRE
ncbi:kelch-like protein 10 [Pelmatolapia mariae]|uniref:kelch-like protein 10 n=1 Tax=Pelmatolapia mariae TaxID=158779 RepID=UPI003211EB51